MQENHKREFKGIWIPAHIWLSQELSMLEKCLLSEIDSLSKDNDGCFASNKYFSDFFNLKENTVSVSISKLKELGYIKQVKFDGRTRWLMVDWQRQTMKKIIPCLLEKSNPDCEKNQSLINNDDNTVYSKEDNITTVHLQANALAPKRFIKPTLEQVKVYIAEKNYSVDAEAWMAHYESNGWRVGRSPMKDWKAAVITWQKNNFGSMRPKEQTREQRNAEIQAELAKLKARDEKYG